MIDLARSGFDPAVREALEKRDLSKPVAMLNLLKFRDQAKYRPEDNEEPCTGREAYARYGRLGTAILGNMGARIIMHGDTWMIGPQGEWDQAFIVRYERASDLIGLPTHPEYRKILHHRTAALSDSRLLMMDFDDTPVG